MSSSSSAHANRDLVKKELQKEVFDVAIVGGGINGAVSAAALAASGLRVALIEKKDFASSTSQESSNLVWGGIKYLESYEFSLVWDLCGSRNELMDRYPSSVSEVRFFTTLQKGFRKPRFLVFLGSILYWFMGRFRTRPPRLLSREAINREEPIVETSTSSGGLEYSDCYLRDNDARFVFQFVRRAMQSGAWALNYTELLSAKKEGDWTLDLEDRASGERYSMKAKVLINAAGPYADSLNQKLGITTRHQHIFSKGVHLIVPRLTTSERVLTFFADDGRLFFVIPMGDRSCIGTTDTPVSQLPAVTEEADRLFILENINKRLRLPKPLTMTDVIAERCGVRPLVQERRNAAEAAEQDWMQLSRKHAIETHKGQRQITIFGGKLTDCLNIGREICEEIEGMGLKAEPGDGWFGEGGERARFEAEAVALGLLNNETGGEGLLFDRLWRCYDRDVFHILKLIQSEPALRERVLPEASVLQAELVHMAEHELVTHWEDILRRRTRLALIRPQAELAKSSALRALSQRVFKDKSDAEWSRYFGYVAN